MNKLTQVRLYLKTKSTSFPDVDGFGDNEPAAHIKTSRSDNEEITKDSASNDEILCIQFLIVGQHLMHLLKKD